MRVEVGTTITLTPLEQRLAKAFAQAMIDYNNQQGRGATQSAKSDLQADIEGVAGEIAFCKLFNVYPDLEIGRHNSWDAVVEGLKIDVKTSTRPTLNCVRWKQPGQVEAYALMQGRMPYFCYRGMIGEEDFFARPMKDVGRGPFRSVGAAELVAWI